MKKNFTTIVLFLFCLRACSQDLHLAGDTPHQDTLGIYQNFFAAAGDGAEAEAEQQDISSLLQSAPDVFTRFAAFNFTAARYRVRGYQSENHLVMVNGIKLNDPESGMGSWSSWGGLNDVTRTSESRSGLAKSRQAFSGAGGYTNIEAGASGFKKGSRIAYAAGNRVFRHRIMLSRSTGMTRRGWAFSAAASARAGEEVYIPGTYFRGYSFYFSADRRISSKNMISFSSFFAPVEQARSNANVLEAYQLAGSNFYNSAWGYQDGKKRNANVSRNKRPVFLLSNIFRKNDREKLVTSAYFTCGRNSGTALNWCDASSPKPDYYRNLPGYYYARRDSVQGNVLTGLWGAESFRQINWDRMTQINRNNLYTDPHLLGQVVNTTETRAVYIMENQVESVRHGGVNLLYNKRFKTAYISAGLNTGLYSNRKYKEVEDLLGAGFWLDVDQFAGDLGVEESVKQNDIDNPNRKVRAGEKFGYDYSINIQRAEAWLQVEHSIKRTEFYYAGTLSCNRIWRYGYIANGKFPVSSKGFSEKPVFVNTGLKAGFTHKFSGRHFLTINSLYQSRMPEASNIFVSPRVRHDLVQGLKNETVAGGDASYHIRYPRFNLRVSLYHTQIKNQVWLRTYWSDEFNNNVNMIMTNVSHTNQGLELGIEKTILRGHILQLIAGYGQFLYSGRPQLQAWQDNNNTSLFEGRTVYLQNFRIGGTPQCIAGAGYKFAGRKGLFLNLTFNFAADQFVEPNPDKRTLQAVEKYSSGEAGIAAAIVEQQQLPSYYFVNLLAGKSFRFSSKHVLNANLSINNLLNNTSVINSGFEQMRWNAAYPGTFAPKFAYMQGLTFLLSINYNF
jgi:hypothetical protein